jgi:hypothetical protein
MRKILFVLTITIITLILLSCEEAFSPQGELDDQYVLNCIIKRDTTFQTATILRSYKTKSNINTTGNSEDHFVHGAKITLTCYNIYGVKEIYNFRDTLISYMDNGGTMADLRCYYIKDFNPTSAVEEINPGVYRRYGYGMKIEAVLPVGKKLTGVSGGDLDSSFINTYKQTNPVDLGPDNLSFVIYSNSQPELVIKYAKLVNGIWIDYQKLIPKYYSKEIPIYPKIESLDKYVQYDTLAIRKTLLELSANDPNKQNYIIKKIVFMLNVLDYNLMTYFSSLQTFSSEFSYRGTPPDYKSISGGLGVFGSMYTIKKDVSLPFMIRSLGYRTN